ncbi:oxidosqualene cyclase helA [Aspergillus lucknowensis]|uniref:Terpene cyclase/mutase family member n=1 Tax=Aspergillus lucknowensis TaxID=176173 RepID=A0ABR4LHT0_9EURO
MPTNDPVVVGQAQFSNTKAASEHRTDLERWRLTVNNGRHMWHYAGDEEHRHRPQSFLEKYWLGLPYEIPRRPRATRPLEAVTNGWEFFKRLQTDDGHWGCNDDGPLFVTSGIVLASYIVGIDLDSHMKQEMCRYLLNVVNDDGGWGLFIQSPSTAFGTVMNYITLRILGLSAGHPALIQARQTLLRLGSARATPTWGKIWLCVLGIYDWEGIIPLVPEPLLLPSSLPFNPGKWWVHTRNVYISMSYLYGHRFVMPPTKLTLSLREELYDTPYHQINWPAQRSNVSAADRLAEATWIQRSFTSALGAFEAFQIPFLRRRALKEALFQIEAEARNTQYLCIAPVSFATNLIALFHAHGPDSHWIRGMRERIIDPMWMCREGLAASGTNGTSLWDTALTVQATLDAGLATRPENRDILRNALEFIDQTQIREDPLGVDHVYRQRTKGAWPFSTRDQSYAVSDTTAEALKVVLLLQQTGVVPPLISTERLTQAVDLILGMENAGGGFSAYEPIRGPQFLELLNITELYENVMTDKLYPECTSSVIMSLTTFSRIHPSYRTNDIHACIARSVHFLLRSQHPNGGWFASWGVCFTYATMFALQGLACQGLVAANCPASRRACTFLLQHQNPDGGWGEDLETVRVKEYVSNTEGSQVTNTAYALIGLLAARCSDHAALRRAVVYLMKQQQDTGEWLPGTLEGVFAPPGGMRYPNYKFHFTLMALGRYAKVYGDEDLSSYLE